MMGKRSIIISVAIVLLVPLVYAMIMLSSKWGWDFVSAEAANRGMDNMDYYMKIEVPEDFSKKAISVMDDNPNRPELKFTQNEGLHYMAATVTDTAIETIKGQLSAQMTETY